MHAHHMCVERSTEQATETGSLLLLCMPQEWNSGHQTW